LTMKPLYDYFFSNNLDVQSKPDKFKKGGGRRDGFKARIINVEKWHDGSMQTHSNRLNSYENIISNFSKGIVFMDLTVCKNGNPFAREVCTGFHLKDGFVMCPAHFYMKYYDEEEVYIVCYINKKRWTIEMPRDCFRVTEDDMVVFKLPRSVPMPKQLYDQIIQASNFEHINDLTEMRFVTTNHDGEIIVRTVHKAPQSGDITYTASGQNIILNHYIAYLGESHPGDSGSPIVMTTSTGENIIVGMHVGVNQRGFKCTSVATCLCKEYIDHILKAFSPHSLALIPHKILQVVSSELSHELPRRSKIKRSVLYGWDGPPERIPTHLTTFKNSDGEEINPVFKAMLKLHQIETVPTDIPNDVLDYLFHLYPPNDNRELLSFEHTLNGDCLKGITSIVGGTSPGYPYSLNKTKGKGPFVTLVDNKYVFQEDFLNKLNEFEKQLIAGNQISVLWGDVLKDELRPIEKVKAGKTRLFSTCPLHYLFLVRR